MGATTEFIKGIIGAASPNGNLMAKAEDQQLLANIRTQRERENRFYQSITICDPQGNPYHVKNIHDLNNLIAMLDHDYNLNALLPKGVISETGVGGEVEEILNQKGYDLKLRGKNKFDEEEQINIANTLNELGKEALRLLVNEDPDFGTNVTNAVTDVFLNDLLLVMSGLTIKGDMMTLFTTVTDTKKASNTAKKIYTDLINGKTINVMQMRTFKENITGSKRISSDIAKKRYTLIRDQEDPNQTKRIEEIKFNPDFNNLSDLAFDRLYAFAELNGLLNKDLHNYAKYDQYGNKLKSPMDADPDIWKQDVCDSVLEALQKSTAFNLNESFRKDVLDLLSKHQVTQSIALNRSFSSLRGFLGELRAYLMVNLLFPYGTGSLVGNKKVQLLNSFRKEDAPVDIFATILNEVYGIQVKNIEDAAFYSWGNINDARGMSINSFYSGRLQSTMSTNEINFFGAYSYNQPVGGNEISNPYSSIYPGFQGRFVTVFTPVYEKLAMYIIRQTTELKQGFDELTHMQNDFFMMGKKIVPASSFMFSLVNEDTAAINSTFEMYSTSPYGHYSSAHKKPASYDGYVKETTIKYSININFAELLKQSAYSV